MTPAQKRWALLPHWRSLVWLALLCMALRPGVAVTNATRYAERTTEVTAYQTELAKAVPAGRTEEQQLQHEPNQVGIDAREKNAAADADGVGLDAAGDRVRVQAGQLAAGAGACTSNTRIADRGTSATRAAMVLSQLLERADARAGDLAKAYDRARIAGLACEHVYELRSTR